MSLYLTYSLIIRLKMWIIDTYLNSRLTGMTWTSILSTELDSRHVIGRDGHLDQSHG